MIIKGFESYIELSWVESRYLYAAPNSLFSHNGAGRWFTHAGKAESSAGAWRCSATVQGLVAKEVNCSRLWGRTPWSSAGQWKSELSAREGLYILHTYRQKWPKQLPQQLVNMLHSWQWQFSRPVSQHEQSLITDGKGNWFSHWMSVVMRQP